MYFKNKPNIIKSFKGRKWPIEKLIENIISFTGNYASEGNIQGPRIMASIYDKANFKISGLTSFSKSLYFI